MTTAIIVLAVVSVAIVFTVNLKIHSPARFHRAVVPVPAKSRQK